MQASLPLVGHHRAVSTSATSPGRDRATRRAARLRSSSLSRPSVSRHAPLQLVGAAARPPRLSPAAPPSTCPVPGIRSPIVSAPQAPPPRPPATRPSFSLRPSLAGRASKRPTFPIPARSTPYPGSQRSPTAPSTVAPLQPPQPGASCYRSRGPSPPVELSPIGRAWSVRHSTSSGRAVREPYSWGIPTEVRSCPSPTPPLSSTLALPAPG